MKLHTLWCYFGRKVSNGRDFYDRGSVAGKEGREVGDEGLEVGIEGAGSGVRGGGKRGSSTPLSTPQYWGG